MGAIFSWLGLGLVGGLSGLSGIAFQLLILLSGVGGAYIWGRVDCANSAQMQGLRRANEELIRQAEAGAAVAAETNREAAEDAAREQKADAQAATIEEVAARPLGPNQCTGVDFLRELDKLR